MKTKGLLGVVLAAGLLLGSATLWAAPADTDGDGIPDLVPIQISAGYLHTCALNSNGVQCWGAGTTNTGSSPDYGQSMVPPLVNPKAVSAGELHTCALDANGVHCWGNSSYGQTNVPTLTNPTMVSAGGYHTCALDDMGVACWGSSFFGQATVPTLSHPTAVSAGAYHTCALDDNGVHCWGNNGAGQTAVPTLSHPAAVSAGEYHTCALDDNGVHCWGAGTTNTGSAPQYGQSIVNTLTNPTAVSTGYAHTCALDDNGVVCWGNNDYGQTAVPALVNPTAVSAGGRHTCALDDNGVHCWGDNIYGQTTVPADLAVRKPFDNCRYVANPNQADADGDDVGDACDAFPNNPNEWQDTDNDGIGDNSDPDIDGDGVLNAADAFPNDSTEWNDTDNDGIGDNSDPDTDGDGVADLVPVQISAGDLHTCALDDDGVHCWGSNGAGQTAVPALVNPTAVSAGGRHTCALDANGVHCWGDNGLGQTTVPTLSHPTAVSAGYFHTCALDDSGVQCWGYNYYGQATVPTLSHPTAVSAGYFHTCALDDNGVHCWGDNGLGQTMLPSLASPTVVSAGGYHTCELDDAGVHCWGKNGAGQTAVPALSHPTAVSAGYEHTCALDANGVHCWGDNGYGQTTVPTLSHPTAVSAGGYHTCALDDDGVVCWGTNNYGQTAALGGLDFSATLLDNCPFAANADQADGDGDGLGNACDPLPVDGNRLNAVQGLLKAEKFGSVVAYVGDFNGDHFGDWAVGVPSHTIPANGSIKAIKDAGQVNIISGNDGSVLAHVEGTLAGDGFGTALAGNADVNGDGLMDVVVGAPKADDPADKKRKDVGTVTVIYGCRGVNCATTSSPRYGSTPKTGFGSAVALGDVDNDNHADVVIGEPKATNDQGEKPLKQAGKVTVLSGASLNTTLLTVYGQTAGALAGTAVAAGDLNGQAGAEVAVGAPKDDDTTASPKPLKDTGSVRVYTNGNTNPIYTQYGAASKDGFGQALAANADVNKDGVKDILVGVLGLDNPADKTLKDVGGVVVLYGSNSGAYSRSANVIGTEVKSGLGSSVALGDVNKDGYADLIVGAPKGDNPTTLPKITKDTGSVTVYTGNGFAPMGSTQYGGVKGDAFGTSLSAGDINADGKADIVIGIPGFDIPANGAVKAIKDAGSASLINATAW